MEGAGTVFNFLLLGVAVPTAGLLLLSNFVAASLAGRFGRTGQVLRWGWLVITIVLSLRVMTTAVPCMGEFN